MLLIQGDARNIQLVDNCIDLAIADPPYNLSRKVPTKTTLFNYQTLSESWDFYTVEDYREFTQAWLKEAYRLLRPGGSLFVTLSYHSLLQAGQAVLEAGFNVVNYITWEKSSAAPSITRRQLTSTCEIILWLSKGPKWTFNYEHAKSYNNGKQLRDMWRLAPPGKSEKAAGKYPAQKPLTLIKRIIEIASNKDDLILDLFSGSGTTSVAAWQTGRQCIAVEMSTEGMAHIERRLKGLNILYELLCDSVEATTGIGEQKQTESETRMYEPTASL